MIDFWLCVRDLRHKETFISNFMSSWPVDQNNVGFASDCVSIKDRDPSFSNCCTLWNTPKMLIILRMVCVKKNWLVWIFWRWKNTFLEHPNFNRTQDKVHSCNWNYKKNPPFSFFDQQKCSIKGSVLYQKFSFCKTGYVQWQTFGYEEDGYIGEKMEANWELIFWRWQWFFSQPPVSSRPRSIMDGHPAPIMIQRSLPCSMLTSFSIFPDPPEMTWIKVCRLDFIFLFSTEVLSSTVLPVVP